MAKIRGKNAPPPSGGQEGWYLDPTNLNRERYWDGSMWTDQFRLMDDSRPTRFVGTMEDAPRGVEACLDCGKEVGLTAPYCPHCGGVHLDVYETGPEEIVLLDIYRAVSTVKTIMVFVVALWLIGVVLLLISAAL